MSPSHCSHTAVHTNKSAVFTGGSSSNDRFFYSCNPTTNSKFTIIDLKANVYFLFSVNKLPLRRGQVQGRSLTLCFLQSNPFLSFLSLGRSNNNNNRYQKALKSSESARNEGSPCAVCRQKAANARVSPLHGRAGARILYLQGISRLMS